MYFESVSTLRGRREAAHSALLQKCGLESAPAEHTVLVWEEDRLLAAGSRDGGILKCIAVDPDCQGRDLAASVITRLRQNAFEAGISHLFLYTKPRNEHLFTPLLFYPVARTDSVLLMESDSRGIRSFLDGLDAPSGECGAIVMNADPFTLGHRYLAETAAAQCQHLLIFVLSEDRGTVPAPDRLELVKKGTRDLSNVTVLPTGPYLISAATFPDYFLKDRDRVTDVHCMLDVEIFVRYFAPRFSISHRFVGSEPLSALTAQYNAVLLEQLPRRGIRVTEVPRLQLEGGIVSASLVRSALARGDREAVEKMVPKTTFDYLFEEEST